MRKLCLMMLVAGCGSNAASPDASAIDSAVGIDAPGRCDPTAPFGTPVPIAELNTTAADVGCARLSADERTIYFYAGTASGADLYMAQRQTAAAPFGTPTPLTALNAPSAADTCPTVSENGLLLLFATTRDAGQGDNLYFATRTSTIGAFAAQGLVAGVNSSVAADSDAEPFLAADGSALWFASNRSGSGFDIYRASSSGGSFQNPVAVTELDSSGDDELPTLSQDLLTIYFASTRPTTSGGYNIWTAHRQNSSDGFPSPIPVTELNSSVNEYPGWLSSDDCRLYFESNTTGQEQLYVASR